jgi:hypothetical protein
MKNETATNQQERKMKHTPTPWTSTLHSDKPTYATIHTGKGERVAEIHRTPSREAGDNLQFIVEACNNYERLKAERDELLAALRKVFDAPNHAFATGDALFDAVEYARRAIAKAEGK